MSKIRTFERTHPWLTFKLESRAFSARLWLLLGEARSKCEHVAGVPLRPAVAQRLHALYLVKGVVATTAIEGNTLSEGQVQARIDGRLELPKSSEYLGREVDNILNLCNSVLSDIAHGEATRLDADRIAEFNRAVLSGLEPELDDGVVPGEFAPFQMVVGKYRAAPPEDAAYLVERLAGWLRELALGVEPNERMAMAILRAVLAHLYLVLIHPFGDGNGRTARMLEFVILIDAGVPSVAAHLMSNHYNRTRTAYYRELSRVSRGDGDVGTFIEYSLQGFVDQLSEQIATIREQQMEVAWINLIHESFRSGKDGQPERRQRALLLALSNLHSEVPATLMRSLSASVADLYRGKTDKTVTRDLNRLVDLKLLVKKPGGYAPNRDLVKAFLPVRNRTDT